jgi:TctA family transporter
MDLTSGILLGFRVALQPINLLYCFIGVCIGTLIGVLPGIGPVGAMSILLPMTFGLSPATSIIMLAGIFYGAMYGVNNFHTGEYSGGGILHCNVFGRISDGRIGRTFLHG